MIIPNWEFLPGVDQQGKKRFASRVIKPDDIGIEPAFSESCFFSHGEKVGNEQNAKIKSTQGILKVRVEESYLASGDYIIII